MCKRRKKKELFDCAIFNVAILFSFVCHSKVKLKRIPRSIDRVWLKTTKRKIKHTSSNTVKSEKTLNDFAFVNDWPKFLRSIISFKCCVVLWFRLVPIENDFSLDLHFFVQRNNERKIGMFQCNNSIDFILNRLYAMYWVS